MQQREEAVTGFDKMVRPYIDSLQKETATGCTEQD